MTIILDALSVILLLSGAALVLTGTIGILRFPNALTQLHAAGITDTLGVTFIILGLMLKAGLSLISLKLLIILFILVFTNPTASHALARAYIHYSKRPWQAQKDSDS